MTVDKSQISITYRGSVFLYVIAVVIFSYRLTGAFTLAAKGAAVLLAFLFAVRLLRGRATFELPMEYRLILIWYIVALISSAFAYSTTVAFLRAFTLAQVLPIGLVLSNLVLWNAGGNFLWRALLYSALLSCGLALAAPGEFVSSDGRVYATLGNSNLFAIVLVVSVCIALWEFVRSTNITIKVAMIFAALFLCYMIAASGSRKGLVGVALVSLIFLIYYVRQSGKQGGFRLVASLLGGVTVVALGAFFVLQSEHVDRLQTVVEVVQEGDVGRGDDSLVGRAYLYKRGFEIFVDNPLLGVGLDNFQMARGRTFGMTIGAYSHSNYLELLTNTGLIGFLLFFGMYFVVGRKLLRCRWMYRSKKYGPKYVLVVSLAILFAAFDFAMVGYYEKIIWIIYAGLIGETELLYRETRKRNRLLALERASA